MSNTVLAGLYVLTNDEPQASDALIERVEAAIRGGARLVQYRRKGAAVELRRSEAAALRSLCHEAGVPLIINDDVALAREVGADGVHLGRHDTTLSAARTVLGARTLIGISCYASLSRAQAAVADGADYVAFGRFFPSVSKPDATAATVDLLPRARAALSVPVVAIGGITPENGAALLAAGADMLAVIHGVFGQPDITAAARRYAGLFAPTAPR